MRHIEEIGLGVESSDGASFPSPISVFYKVVYENGGVKVKYISFRRWWMYWMRFCKWAHKSPYLWQLAFNICPQTILMRRSLNSDTT